MLLLLLLLCCFPNIIVEAWEESDLFCPEPYVEAIFEFLRIYWKSENLINTDATDRIKYINLP